MDFIQKVVKGTCGLDIVREFRFHPTRMWRSDYALPDKKILIEIEGGAWSGGRHTRGKGFIADMEKYNAAAMLGYRILRYTPQQIANLADDLNAIKKEEWK